MKIFDFVETEVLTKALVPTLVPITEYFERSATNTQRLPHHHNDAVVNVKRELDEDDKAMFAKNGRLLAALR